MNTSKGVRIGLAAGTAAAVIVALTLSIMMNVKDYVVLYDELTSGESSEILAQLQQMGVDVKLDGNGSVTVLEKDESRVRMALATAGYPKSGLSYYMLEKASGMLTTDYERQQYQNAQLQERIASSIKTLDGVKDAIVTITSPGEKVFYLQEKEPPSASVIIHMQSGGVLSDNQVMGIQNLVVKSVAGLTKENVAISDSGGNDITGNSFGSSNHTKIGITREIENDIKKKILAVLEGPYGREKLRISVSAVVDTDDLFTEEKTYKPSPDGDNTGVISQENRGEESSSTTQADGGVAGTTSNSEVPIYPVAGASGESTSSSSTESTTYLVSQVISQFQKEGAKIESVSIGIALDQPTLAQEERDRITRLVAYAVGVPAESIAVENFVFFKDDNSGGAQQPGEAAAGKSLFGIDMLYIYAGAGALVLLIIGAIIIISGRGRKKRKREALEMEEEAAKQGAINQLFGQGEELPQITPVRDARREQIREFAETNPEIAAQMIRSWLKSENDTE
ncbi:flagellar basal-body MS-ring/collar protein FliF [Bacillota bacterium]